MYGFPHDTYAGGSSGIPKFAALRVHRAGVLQGQPSFYPYGSYAGGSSGISTFLPLACICWGFLRDIQVSSLIMHMLGVPHG